MDLDPTLPLPEILDHLQAGMTARVDEQGTVTPLLGGRFGHEHLPGPPMDRPREVTCAMLPDGVLNDHCRERSLHRQERRKSGGRRGRRANEFFLVCVMQSDRGFRRGHRAVRPHSAADGPVNDPREADVARAGHLLADAIGPVWPPVHHL